MVQSVNRNRPQPTWKQNFARSAGESAHSWAWRGLDGAWAAGLGPTGDTLHDIASKKKNGTLTSMDPSTDWVVEEGRYTLFYDGGNDHINLGTDLHNDGNLTISSWHKTNGDYTTQQALFGNGNGSNTNTSYMLTFGFNNDKYDFWQDATGSKLVSNTAISTDEWRHVVVTRKDNGDGTWELILYLNGKQDGSNSAETVDPGTTAAGQQTSISRFGSFNSYFVNGWIDETLFYSRALSAAEVWKLYQLGRGGIFQRKRMFTDTPVKAQRIRRALRYAVRKPRTIARDRRQSQLLQTDEWVGDGMKLNTDGELVPNLSDDLTTNTTGQIEVVEGSLLPVLDTTKIVKDPTDPTRTMRIDVGAVGVATTRVLNMPDFDLDFSALVLGAGLSTADGTLHVHTASAGSVTAHADADEVVVENSDHAGISILTPANKIGNIYFGDANSNNAAQISYDHNTDIFTLGVAGVAYLRMEFSGTQIRAKQKFNLEAASGDILVCKDATGFVINDGSDAKVGTYDTAGRPDSTTAGLVIFNTTTSTPNWATGSAWIDVTDISAHATTHQSGGSDAIKLDDLSAPDDNTDLNASTTAHGLLPKLNNVVTDFLNGQGGYTAPATLAHATSHQSGGSDAVKLDNLSAPDDNTDLNASTTKHGLLLKLDNVVTNFLTGQGTWAVPAGSADIELGAPSTLTISSGAVTKTGSNHLIAVESGSTDDLLTINGGSDGDVLIISPADGAEDIVITDLGNIATTDAASFTMDSLQHTSVLLYRANQTKWVEIGRNPVA